MFKEGKEPSDYRDNLAEELKEAPKEERAEILEQAKQTPEYQIARNKKIEAGQNEEEINEGEGVFIKHRTLYHGTTVENIKEFKKADETTIGEGIYLTSQAKDAIGYANRRTANRTTSTNKETIKPIIYEVSIENLKLIDFRKDENVKKSLRKWIPVLKKEAERKDLKYYHLNAINEAIGLIWSGKVNSGNVSPIAAAIGENFTDFIKSLGYDGLITFEGGEGEHVKNHDSYVIFDPEKVKMIKEQKIKNEK